MIEKRRRIQSPYETGSDDQDDIVDDKKSKTTPIVYILLIVTLIVGCILYFGNVDVRAAFSSPSTYRISSTTNLKSSTLNANPLSSIPDSDRPTIVHDPNALTNERKNANSIPHIDVLPHAKVEASAPLLLSVEELTAEAEKQIEVIAAMKRSGTVMETSEDAKREIAILQKQLQTLIPLKYGPGPYRLEMTLRFPDSMLTDPGLPAEEAIRVDMAPIDLVPYSVYYFLSVVVDGFQGGAFHRNAGHVLQAMVRSRHAGLAFQEYSPQFPHKQYTLGYAGRPGGPAFYISTLDNTQNHGPASQGSKTEADGCFGAIADADGVRVVRRMGRQPGGAKGSGFIQDTRNNIQIAGIRLVR